MKFDTIRVLVAVVVFSISSYAHAAPSPSEMLDASVAGDEAKVLEIKSRIELGEKPARGDRKVARDLNAKGVVALNAGNYLDAVNLLKQAMQVDSADSEVVTNLGYALLKANKLDEAKDTLNRALTLQPGRSSPWVNLGEVLARQGKVSNATAAFNIAYLFSQNRDKTRAFFQKLIDENASPDLVTAAKSALDANGIKVVGAQSTGLQHGAKSGSETQEIAPLSEPPSDPTPAVTQPSTANAIPTASPAIPPKGVESGKAVADEKSEAKAAKTKGEDNESGIKNFAITAILTVVVWGLIFVAARAIWRRVKEIRSRSSTEGRIWPGRGTMIRIFLAGVVLAIAFSVSRDWMHYQEKSATAQAKAPPPRQVATSNGRVALTREQKKLVCMGDAMTRYTALIAVSSGESLDALYDKAGENAAIFLRDDPSISRAYMEQLIRAGIGNYEHMAPQKRNQQLALLQQYGELGFLSALRTVCLKGMGE